MKNYKAKKTTMLAFKALEVCEDTFGCCSCLFVFWFLLNMYLMEEQVT